MVVDPLLCQSIQLVQLLLGISIGGKLHFEPGDKLSFDQLERKVLIITMDSLHRLINGEPSPIFSDEPAMSGVKIHLFQTLPGGFHQFIGKLATRRVHPLKQSIDERIILEYDSFTLFVHSLWTLCLFSYWLRASFIISLECSMLNAIHSLLSFLKRL